MIHDGVRTLRTGIIALRSKLLHHYNSRNKTSLRQPNYQELELRPDCIKEDADLGMFVLFLRLIWKFLFPVHLFFTQPHLDKCIPFSKKLSRTVSVLFSAVL